MPETQLSGQAAKTNLGPPRAGWMRRTAAFVCDIAFFVLLGEAASLLLACLAPGLGQRLEAVLSSWGIAAYFAASVLVWGETPGSIFAGIHTLDVDYAPLGGARLLGRLLVFGATLPLCALNVFLVGLTRQKRAMHDLACGTWVAVVPSATRRQLVGSALTACVLAAWLGLRLVAATSDAVDLKRALAGGRGPAAEEGLPKALAP